MSRVLLRPPEPADRAAFLASVEASRALHHPWIVPPSTPEAFDAWLLRCQLDRHAGYLVCRREDGALAGYLNISEIVRGAFESAFLGYGAFAPLAGRGYMTEGVALAVAEAFGPLGLHRLEANIQPGNEPSLALARRLGFRREGYSPRYLRVGEEWRDHERWAILREDWRGPGR